MGFERFIELAFLGLTGALVAIVALKLLSLVSAGTGMLSSEAGGEVEAERVQLIGATLAAAVGYGAACLATLGAEPPRLVDPEQWMLIVAAGGNSVYLAGKLWRHRR